uniref:Uncharacterized protein n=1 Tax=Plectus sambesii TaxID=2011161 RepID=A0A914X0V6_9BILA
MSGPTSGTGYLNELYEWARQIRRWTIGAAEVFHYFVVKSSRLPLSVSLPWALKFLFYYGIFLCVAPLYFTTAPIITWIMLETQIMPDAGYLISSATIFAYILLGMFVLQYIWLALVFIICRLAETSFPDSIKDETSSARSAFHWLMTFSTLLGCAAIGFWAFLEISVRGKSACQHKASKKDGLILVEPTEMEIFAQDMDEQCYKNVERPETVTLKLLQ